MRTFNIFCVCVCLASSLAQAAERPTLLQTCDPRPDILPRPFYDNHTDYRAQYNRPRFYTGWLAYEVSRTSQEAMVWKENYCAGNYDQHHMPPVCKTYYYPKPWEVLTVGARPDFAAAKPKTQRVPPATKSESMEEPSAKPLNPIGSDEKAASENADTKSESEKDEVNATEEPKREVVPSPSDKTSSRSTPVKQKPVTTKPSPAKSNTKPAAKKAS